MTSSHPTPPSKPGQNRSHGRLATWQRALRATFSLTLVLKNLRWLGEPFIWMPALVISLATLGAWKFWKSPNAGDVGNQDGDRVDWLSLLESQPDADSVAADIDSSNVLATELVVPAAKPGNKNAKNQGNNNKDKDSAGNDDNASQQALSDIMKLLNLTGSSPAGGRSRGEGAPANPAQGSDRPALPDTQFSQFSQFLNNSSSGDRLGGTSTTGGAAQAVSPLQAALDRLYLNNTEGNPGAEPTTAASGTPASTMPASTTAPATANPTQPIGSGYNPGAVPGYGAGYGLPGSIPGSIPGAGAGFNPGINPGINPGGTVPKIPTAGLYGQPGGSSASPNAPLNAGYNTVPNSAPAAPSQPAPAAAPEPDTSEPQSNINGRPIRTFSNPW
ncbi:MAG: hypothetical protein EA001_15210 [Oscillatoriales cyanobacterium]|nr:MAG: hypothetical protein EA001_15210 [Oscillatoriales cyanobacterium]